MTRRNERFVTEFVNLFGFLNGLWIYAGVNPESEILRAFTDLVPGMSSVLFWLVTITCAVATIAAAYTFGKWLGLVAILAAFLGGVFIESWGIWSLLIGMGIGWYAPMQRAR